MIIRHIVLNGEKMLVYLDNSATTKAHSSVVNKMAHVMEEDYGNPSALHEMGFVAEKHMKQARKNVADLILAAPESIVFTSGGTEADNIAIQGAMLKQGKRGGHIITQDTEHPAVLETIKEMEKRGATITRLAVDNFGNVNLDALKSAIKEDTMLISIMHVNNETGTIMPIGSIGKIKREAEQRLGKKILFHCDAVQSVGKLPINVNGDFEDVDVLAMSAHKIYGPKGVGAIYIKKGISLPASYYGGGQEGGLRSGTENTPGISGFGVAAQLAKSNLDEHFGSAAKKRKQLLSGLLAEVDDIRVNSPDDGSPYILNVSFLGVRGEVLLHDLERSGIFVSTGSACSSKKKSGSHVLAAMGLSNAESEGAIRFSFGMQNTIKEIDYTVDKVKEAVSRFRKLGRFR